MGVSGLRDAFNSAAPFGMVKFIQASHFKSSLNGDDWLEIEYEIGLPDNNPKRASVAAKIGGRSDIEVAAELGRNFHGCV